MTCGLYFFFVGGDVRVELGVFGVYMFGVYAPGVFGVYMFGAYPLGVFGVYMFGVYAPGVYALGVTTLVFPLVALAF